MKFIKKSVFGRTIHECENAVAIQANKNGASKQMMNRVCSTKENLMKILCKSAQQIPASTQVKRVGKYLYKHLETSYDFNSGSNMYDVYFTLYYQKKHPKLGIAINGIQEIQININITTYQNISVHLLLYTIKRPFHGGK